MNASLRCGAALSAIAACTLLIGCSSSSRGTRHFGGPVPGSKVGLASRAQLALAANKVDEALPLAEKAVAGNPRDAGFRSLLGNVYLAAGRFASAEAAFADALALYPQQPRVALKLALVEIALGKREMALEWLEQVRAELEPADYGLALALAGRVDDAVAVLNDAARQPGADARLRQNLALAHALAGDWISARTVAAQDVPADQLDSRIAEWMKFAEPSGSATRVAALIGVAPASDPGMPVRLALAAPAASPRLAASTADVAQPQPAALPAAPAPVEPAISPLAVEVTSAAPEAVIVPEQLAALPEVRVSLQQPSPPPAAGVKVEARTVRPAQRVAAPAATGAAAKSKPLLGSSRSVVQLGAYGSRRRLTQAWSQAVRRHSALRGYSPVASRISTPSGELYRLSVRGFASSHEAFGLCSALRRSGTDCFVRAQSGDSPFRLALR